MKRKDKKDAIRRELESIRKRRKGLLRPADVVEFAKNPKTALHGCFTWDDTKAAMEYRLWQAREIIRVQLTVIEGQRRSIRAYVSLQEDRKRPGGGYDTIVRVMSTEDRREALLREALQELNRLRAKYRQLKELAPVFDAMSNVEKARKKAAG